MNKRKAKGSSKQRRGSGKPLLHPMIRTALKVPKDQSDADFLRLWRAKKRLVCKPCWELRYCPYGPLVEDFPLLPLTRPDVESHNEYLAKCLETGRLADGKKLDAKRRAAFKEDIAFFKPAEHPDTIPQVLSEMSCTVFGHICPVIYSAEPFTETVEQRRSGRYIPFKTKIRVVRRDNYTCQHCGVHLLDNEVEFDHVIPLSKGGSSDEHNLRLTCHSCNHDKSDSVSV